MSIYFLSIRSQYAAMIVAGDKKWEFRKNPAFGDSLTKGDHLFVVSTGPDSASIVCLCLVEDILQGNEVPNYFADPASGHWCEAGCREGTDRDWTFFSQNILEQYPVAIKLSVNPLIPELELSEVQHSSRHTAWKGIGFTPITNLRKFVVKGVSAEDFFEKMVAKTPFYNL